MNARLSPEARGSLGEFAVLAVLIGFVFHHLRQEQITFDSKVWPYLLLGLTALVLVCATASTILRGDSARPSDAPTFDQPGRRWAFMASYAIYIAVIEPLGFLVATALFMVGGALIYGVKKPVPLGISLAVAVAIYMSFIHLFDVPLPSGALASFIP